MVPPSTWPPAWYRPDCRLCPRLAAFLAAVRERHPDYHARPVGPFGDPAAPLLIVGLAPGMHGANRTGRPFTGDHAGLLLYRTLFDAGLANQPDGTEPDDGLRLIGCRISNAVKCLPPENKPKGDEVRNCNRYLAAELHDARPRAVLALGRVAHEATLRAYGLPLAARPFAHGREHALPGGSRLLDCYHCSRYNTQTGRLTDLMFREVVTRAAALAGLTQPHER
jgi:uracil-DNA glycosylase family 4